MTRIELKTAEERDLGKIKALTDRMLEPTGLGLATATKIRNLVLSPKTLFLLAWADDELIGYTCGVLHESVFNDRVRVTDIGVYVEPEYRSGSVTRRMIDYLEQWAKNQGAEELWLGQTTGQDIDKVEKYYNRLGYATKGFNCVKEL